MSNMATLIEHSLALFEQERTNQIGIPALLSRLEVKLEKMQAENDILNALLCRACLELGTPKASKSENVVSINIGLGVDDE